MLRVFFWWERAKEGRGGKEETERDKERKKHIKIYEISLPEK